jgi:predicted enzyme related to lactoylglutathione lyase
MFLGLRTVIYPVEDMVTAKRWFTELLGFGPYFDEPFYIGFEVAGYELGLLPAGEAGSSDGPLTYWGVGDAEAAFAKLIAAGATVHVSVSEVGAGIKTGTVREPGGNIIGVIENPIFSLPDPATLPPPDGPGR